MLLKIKDKVEDLIEPVVTVDISEELCLPMFTLCRPGLIETQLSWDYYLKTMVWR